MKIVNITANKPREELLYLIKNHELVNRAVKFDEKLGIPKIKVKEKGEKLHISCELVGRPTKDNGFIVGTYFIGRLVGSVSTSTLRGVILTAPIYHFALLVLFVVFIFRCIELGGISLTPIFLLLLNYFMFSTEYKKQGIIERFLIRCAKFGKSAN